MVTYKKIVAIIRKAHLEKVERSLEEFGVKGITVWQVKGFGEYANYFTRDWMCSHTHIELFVREEKVEPIVERIIEAAHTGMAGDGMIAVTPLETVYRIKTKRPATADEI